MVEAHEDSSNRNSGLSGKRKEAACHHSFGQAISVLERPKVSGFNRIDIARSRKPNELETADFINQGMYEIYAHHGGLGSNLVRGPSRN